MTITNTWQILSATTACLVQNQDTDSNTMLIKYDSALPTDETNSIVVDHDEPILLPAPLSGSIYIKKKKDFYDDITITVVGV